MRATFITLAIEEGADAEVLETRVTHTRKSRTSFDGYNRGLHWERTCAEVAKLRVSRGRRAQQTQAVRAANTAESQDIDDPLLQRCYTNLEIP